MRWGINIQGLLWVCGPMLVTSIFVYFISLFEGENKTNLSSWEKWMRKTNRFVAIAIPILFFAVLFLAGAYPVTGCC